MSNRPYDSFEFWHDLSQQNDTTRNNVLRHLAKTDLFFLCRYVIGWEFYDNRFARWFCDLVQKDPWCLWLVARGHLKSLTITCAHTIQCILNDPEKSTLILSYTAPMAKTFLRQIKFILETNEKLKKLFPDILYSQPDKQSPKWTEDAITVKRQTTRKEATIETSGLVEGQKIGLHCFDGNTFVSMADGARKKIKDIKIGDKVKTPFGESVVLETMTHRATNIIDKKYIKATANHLFFGTKKLERFDLLCYDEIIKETIWHKIKTQIKLFMIQSSGISAKTDTLQLDEKTLNNVLYTDISGKNLMAQFPKVLLYTIKIITKEIMTSQILYVCLRACTKICTILKKHIIVSTAEKRYHTMERHNVAKVATTKRHGLTEKGKRRARHVNILTDFAKNVAKFCLGMGLLPFAAVVHLLNTTKAKRTEKLQSKATNVAGVVYDIKTTHRCFYANGLLVHNCDYMKYDDVVVPASVGTPEMIEKTTKAWELSGNLGMKTSPTLKAYCGTRYHYFDTYSVMIARGIKTKLIPATHNGKMDGIPIYMTQEALNQELNDQGIYTFSAQMLLNPVSDKDKKFRRDWIQYWDELPAGLRLYEIGDPANAKKKKSDWSAFGIIGIDSDGNIYLIDAVHDKLSLGERYKQYFALYDKYRPHIAGYEKYGMQSDLEFFRLECKRLGRPLLPIHEIGGVLSKEDRILRLVPDMQAGKFFFPRKLERWCSYDEKMVDIVERILIELDNFPMGQHDDLIDMVSRIYDLRPIMPAPVKTPEEQGFEAALREKERREKRLDFGRTKLYTRNNKKNWWEK